MHRDSVLWRVSRERLVVLAWSRAILMQLAHPLVAAGVWQHSAYRGGAIQAAARLHHTVGAMLALTFADAPRRAATVEHIKAIHRRVHGTLADTAGIFPAGTRYSAEDPALLLWVHVTLIDSSADLFTRIVGPLAQSDLDTLCDEAATTLLDLGGDASTAPRTWDALQARLREADARGALHVTPPAHALADAILTPRVAGVPTPFSAWQRRVTLGLLPAHFRTAYGVPWDETDERAFSRALRHLRAVRRLAPRRLAWWRAATAPRPPSRP